MVRSRFAAAGIHLVLSAVVLGLLFAVALLMWYPGAHFHIAGAREPALLLIGVDLVLGPLVTLIIYRAGKPGLRFDLTVIALVQLAALAYGGWALASQKPVFLVFDDGFFQVMAWPDVEAEQVTDELREQIPVAGPLTVWAEPIDDPDALFGLLAAGRLENQLPGRYRPLAEAVGLLGQSGLSLAAAMADDATVRRAVDRAFGEKETAPGWRLYPVYGRRDGWSVVVDVERAEIVHFLPAPVRWVRPGKAPGS